MMTSLLVYQVVYRGMNFNSKNDLVHQKGHHSKIATS
jgi:hypothetical protein